jgi:hypothetical protein
VDKHLLRVEEKTNNNGQPSYVYEFAFDYLLDKIEVDEATQRRKVAQEIIEQKLPHFRRYGLTLSSEEMDLISTHLKEIILSEEAKELLDISKRRIRREKIKDGLVKILLSGIATIPISVASVWLMGGTSSVVGYVAALWGFVVLFSIIGGMRGWAKEMLVFFSMLLALAFVALIERIPFIQQLLPITNLYLHIIITCTLVFFGYQTPNIARFAPRMVREQFQDVLLGVLLGAMNGFWIVGSLWFWISEANYPSPFTAPDPSALKLLQYMPPNILDGPGIFIALVIAFIFVFVVFI